MLAQCPTSNGSGGGGPVISVMTFDRAGRWLGLSVINLTAASAAMSLEMHRLVEAFGYGWSDLERFTIGAMKSVFIPFDERLAIIDEVIEPRYAVLIG